MYIDKLIKLIHVVYLYALSKLERNNEISLKMYVSYISATLLTEYII